MRCDYSKIDFRHGVVVRVGICGFILTCCALSARGLAIRNYDASRHDRFSSGYPSNPQPNTNFWLAAHDFSGVGWDASNADRSVTLVSPRHFLAADHFRPAIGATLFFLNRHDVLQSNTVAAYHTTTNDAGEATDVVLGELSDSSLADNEVSYYAIAAYETEAEYAGLPVIMYGKSARAGAGTIDGFTDVSVSGEKNTTRCFEVNYNKLSGDGDDAHVESGDSGSPSFLLVSNRLALVGVHSGIQDAPTACTTYDGFVPHYLNQLNAATREGGYQLALSPPPAIQSYITDIAVDGTNVTLEWTATNFVNYTLLFTTNKLTSKIIWQEVPPISRFGPQEAPYRMSGTNQPASSLPFRFYRVRIEVQQAPGQ